MRPTLSLATILLLVAAPLAAQDPKLASAPTTLTPALETIAVTTFDIRKATSNFVLAATFRGLLPTHYQISQHADFRDASWLAWPASAQPAWHGAGSGACGQNVLKVVGYFRARAWRPSTQSYTVSNIVRDTLCIPFG